MTLTVTSGPATSQLTTLTACKAELSISGTDDDTYLSSLIDAVSSTIVAYTKRGCFGLASYLQSFTPVARRGQHWFPYPRVALDRFPITSVASVIENGITLSSSDYQVDSENGILWRLDSRGYEIDWPNVLIVVAFTAGWKLPNDTGRTLPVEIERAAILLVRDAYLGRGRDGAVKQEVLDGLGSVSYGSGITGNILPAPIESLLAPYRLALV